MRDSNAGFTNSGTPANTCTTTITLASDGHITDDAWVRLSPAAYDAVLTTARELYAARAELAQHAALVVAVEEWAAARDARLDAQIRVELAYHANGALVDNALFDAVRSGWDSEHEAAAALALTVQPAASVAREEGEA